MPFSIRPFRRFLFQCHVTYYASLFLKVPLACCLGFGSMSIPCLGSWQIAGQKGSIASPR